MTAPIWMASPPEVHSTLLSSGPGPGPLLAAAQAWTSLSTAYTDTVEELTALLAGTQAGAWEGPAAAAYAASHAPYIAWLTQAAADNVSMAARQELAAAAYTTALAAMPTVAELAVNHTTHAVLLATNFFGINAIPIAVNEADYVRMWIQAATVMSTYHAVSTAAVASSPQTAAAPQIVNLQALVDAFYKAFPLPSDTQTQVFDRLLQIGYSDFYNNSIQPLIDALANDPFFASMLAPIDPYLLLLGNPLIFLSPYNIAFALGYPMDIGSYVAYLSQTFSFIALDLTAAFASGNPAVIGVTILFTTVEAVGTIITDTIALLKTLIEQTAALLTVFVPLLTAPLVSVVPLAAGAALAPVGLTGLAGLAAVPPPVPPPFMPPAMALAPSIPTPTSTPASAPLAATAPATTTAPPPPAGAAPPTVTGAGIGAGMGAGMDAGVGAGLGNFAYLVGNLNSAAWRAAGTDARKKAPRPGSTEVPAVAPTPKEPAPTRRRRRTKVQMLGRGYEYLDVEDAPDAPDAPEVSASMQGAGTQGFAGTAAKTGAGRAAGLAKLAGDAFGGGPRMPMIPGTWSAGDSAGASAVDGESS
jgi:PPE-repeat protein